MPTFFNTLDELDKFTMELELHQDELQCVNCHKSDQFVSHGYVYKKKNKNERRIVGKRIFCSNRFGKLGCGCTLRFYLAIDIPKLQFNTAHVTTFLTHLFKGSSIEKSYATATGTAEPRQAYRWLKKLDLKRLDYRHASSQCIQAATQLCTSANRRVRLLLSSLQPLWFNRTLKATSLCASQANPCEHYQYLQQTAFL